ERGDAMRAQLRNIDRPALFPDAIAAEAPTGLQQVVVNPAQIDVALGAQPPGTIRRNGAIAVAHLRVGSLGKGEHHQRCGDEFGQTRHTISPFQRGNVCVQVRTGRYRQATLLRRPRHRAYRWLASGKLNGTAQLCRFGSTDNATIRTARWFRAESENAGVGSTDSRYYPKLSHGRNDGCAPKCGVWQQHSTGDPHQTAHDLGDAPGL